MARQLKGKRKLMSLYRREECLKILHSVFQKAYLKAQGTPQQRFEIACQATDAEVLKASQAEPSKRSFWMMVVDDLKNHLTNLVENQELVEKAVEVANGGAVKV